MKLTLGAVETGLVASSWWHVPVFAHPFSILRTRQHEWHTPLAVPVKKSETSRSGSFLTNPCLQVFGALIRWFSLKPAIFSVTSDM